MTPQQAFLAVNAAVMPFWLLMIIAPKWRVTNALMRSSWPVALMPAVYAALIVPRLGGVAEFFTSPPDLAKTAAFLGTPEGCLVGWVHFLAFDLFVGRWVYLTSRDEQRPPWLMAPILFLTLMLGPIGLLLFFILRAAAPRRT